MYLQDACTCVQPELRPDKEERITMLALKTNPLKPMRSFDFFPFSSNIFSERKCDSYDVQVILLFLENIIGKKMPRKKLKKS